MTSNFGLIDQSYDTDGTVPSTSTEPTSWERFAHKLSMMNKQSHSETSYKLLFLGRHGQGYHNVAEQYYGTKAWDVSFPFLLAHIFFRCSLLYHDHFLTKPCLLSSVVLLLRLTWQWHHNLA